MNNFQVTEHGGINPETESPKLVAQHKSAYAFITPHVSGKDVLEIGHGDGYGSAGLSESARSVTAIDLFERNVAAAAVKYMKPNLKFRAMNATDLKLADGSMDVVCSFQVIEHIPRDLLDRYMTEIRRVLRNGGKAFISTLNLKKNQKPGQPYDKSPDHDREFTPEDYRGFFRSYFDQVDFYGLYPGKALTCMERVKKSGIFRRWPAAINPVSRFYQSIGTGSLEWKQKDDLDGCIDLMAVATR